MTITAGELCDGTCLCGGATINASGAARYQAQVASITTELCACGFAEPPICASGRCVLCGFANDPPECSVVDPPPPMFDAGVTCKQQGAGGGSGSSGGSCSVQASESCSDGTTYNVTCSCPSATCSCSESFAGGGGSSSGGMTFAGCPDDCGQKTLELGYQACGFPIPQ
jgi:hypothetical protein